MSDKIVHIVAESSVYSVYEFVPEHKAVKRLEKIRDMFSAQERRFGTSASGTLKVKTCVVNPEFNFHHY